MESSVKEWKLFFERCVEHRIQSDLFDAAVAQLHARSPLPGRKLTGLLLQPRSAGACSVDPRVITYLERLLASKKVDASDVLSATFQHSKDRSPETGDHASSQESRWINPPELEEIVFHRLAKVFATEERPMNNTEGLRTVMVVARWMQSMVASHTSDTMIQAMSGIQQHPQQQSINVREGLGMLVVSLVENQRILRLLNDRKARGGSKISSL